MGAISSKPINKAAVKATSPKSGRGLFQPEHKAATAGITDKAELHKFINEGARTEASRILKDKPYLALEQGAFIDYFFKLKRRSFAEISLLQYCYWGYDRHGVNTILRHLSEVQKAEAYRQLEEVDEFGVDYLQYSLLNDEDKPVPVQNEKRFNMQLAKEAYEKYLKEKVLEHYVNIAYQQRLFPIHILQEHCRLEWGLLQDEISFSKEDGLPEKILICNSSGEKIQHRIDSLSSINDSFMSMSGTEYLIMVSHDRTKSATPHMKADFSKLQQLIEARQAELVTIKASLHQHAVCRLSRR